MSRQRTLESPRSILAGEIQESSKERALEAGLEVWPSGVWLAEGG
jgi:hypothetical protein